MRVAYVCADPGVPVFGSKGCSIHVQEILRAMKRNGARLTLFARSVGGTAPPGLADIEIRRLPDLPRGESGRRPAMGRSSNAVLRVLLELGGPFDLIYERYSLWNFAAMEYAEAAGIPGLLEVNAPLIEEQRRYRSLPSPASARAVEARVFGAARALIAVSREVARYIERHPGTAGKVQVVPNGVDPERFPEGLQPSSPARPGVLTLGFVGTLKPWHGLPVLAAAFAVLARERAGLRLLIVGDGPEKERLASTFEAFNLSGRVDWTGAVAPARIPALLASMDVAVAPYEDLPGFYFSPLKVYEYMAARLPVVASEIGQLADLIQDGVNGILFSPGSSEGLAAAVERLLADPQARMRLGLAARRTVENDYTWDRIARRVLRLAGPEHASSPKGNQQELIGS